MQAIKGLIRRGECRAAGRDCGIPVDRLHFMDLPFYETGAVRKKPLGPEDVRLTVELLDEVRPHQVYAAGDLSDPHGTHRVCLSAVTAAFEQLGGTGLGPPVPGVAVPRGVAGVGPGADRDGRPDQPRRAAAEADGHLQAPEPEGPGHVPRGDQREFWQRAEDRNRGTARVYDDLGLAEYEAVEGFVRWRPAWQTA